MNGESLYYYSYLRIGEWINFTWVLLYLLDMLFLYILFRFDFREVLFYGSASYTMQHLMKRILFLICSLFNIPVHSTGYSIAGLVLLIIAFGVYYLVFVRRIKAGEHINSKNIPIISISAVTVFLYCFLSSYDDQYSSGNISLRITTMMTDILILVLLFGLFEQSKAKKEKEDMTRMLHEKEEDMILSKKNIEMINMKTHDLKHQIDALRNMETINKDKRLDEIENEINFYDNVVHTKNEVINIVVTKKSLYCQKHGIKINYYLDDEDISFIDDVDLYTMLGNILDNAIEALLKVPDKEKRIIYFKVLKKKGLLSITEENYTSQQLVFQNGFPITSKTDKAYHGIGLMSIDFLTKKYHGNMTLECKDDMFHLCILIPIKEK